MRWMGSLMAMAAALLLLPTAQAWITSSPTVICEGPGTMECGPVEDVLELVDDLCVPAVGVSGDAPFLTVDDDCHLGPSSASPPEAPSQSSPDNSTGGP